MEGNETSMPPPEYDVYDRFCSKRFEKIEKALENDIPHQISGLFWKMLGIMLTFSGIILAVVKLT
jgi:hypothetical protein